MSAGRATARTSHSSAIRRPTSLRRFGARASRAASTTRCRPFWRATAFAPSGSMTSTWRARCFRRCRFPRGHRFVALARAVSRGSNRATACSCRSSTRSVGCGASEHGAFANTTRTIRSACPPQATRTGTSFSPAVRVSPCSRAVGKRWVGSHDLASSSPRASPIFSRGRRGAPTPPKRCRSSSACSPGRGRTTLPDASLDGARVVVRTHHDAAGDACAEAIWRSLEGRAAVHRSRPT